MPRTLARPWPTLVAVVAVVAMLLGLVEGIETRFAEVLGGKVPDIGREELQDVAKLLISVVIGGWPMQAERSICWSLSRNTKTRRACSHPTRTTADAGTAPLSRPGDYKEGQREKREIGEMAC